MDFYTFTKNGHTFYYGTIWANSKAAAQDEATVRSLGKAAA